MSKVFNMVGGGGGKNISSIIITGLSSTDTVTCTKDGKTYPATWDDTDQHWEIVGLPLGTFTIAATNGTKTKTETVLIDIAGVYEIEMSLVFWLYKYGNEYEEVTGGWVACDAINGYTISSNSKNTDNLLSKILTGNPTSRCAGFRTVNKIDFSAFNELHFMVSDMKNPNNINIGLSYSETDKTCESWGINTGKIVIGDNVMDISNKTDSYYVKFGLWASDVNHTASLCITRVWLE